MLNWAPYINSLKSIDFGLMIFSSDLSKIPRLSAESMSYPNSNILMWSFFLLWANLCLLLDSSSLWSESFFFWVPYGWRVILQNSGLLKVLKHSTSSKKKSSMPLWMESTLLLKVSWHLNGLGLTSSPVLLSISSKPRRSSRWKIGFTKSYKSMKSGQIKSGCSAGVIE